MKELILTGIKELWPQDESNSIFLGPWCFAGNHTKAKCQPKRSKVDC